LVCCVNVFFYKILLQTVTFGKEIAILEKMCKITAGI
jgi:hypothetical protein